jgi:O-antigen/teichoic acid export membrane protein
MQTHAHSASGNDKVDQIMLRWMVGAAEVGIYSVAVTLSETWYFIPTVIATSAFPRLIELKTSQPSIYHKRLQQLLQTSINLYFNFWTFFMT